MTLPLTLSQQGRCACAHRPRSVPPSTTVDTSASVDKDRRRPRRLPREMTPSPREDRCPPPRPPGRRRPAPPRRKARAVLRTSARGGRRRLRHCQHPVYHNVYPVDLPVRMAVPATPLLLRGHPRAHDHKGRPSHRRPSRKWCPAAAPGPRWVPMSIPSPHHSTTAS